VHWGYTIPPEAERLSWFKLLLAGEHLQQDIRESQKLKATAKLLRQLNKGVEEVTADYLKLIWDFAMIQIRTQNPRSIDGMPFRVVIGIPAKWPQEARVKMRNAAAKAGLLDSRPGGLATELEFVAEPEAAAVAAFHDGNLRHSIHVSFVATG
jgi:molecular chaperone DnaK (HSP70)